jgi:hypothetical protein
MLDDIDAIGFEKKMENKKKDDDKRDNILRQG